MTSPGGGGELAALVYHPTPKVSKAEEFNYLSINIEFLTHGGRWDNDEMGTLVS